MALRSNKAFTLIELLVVIAIIALLLSILMPALTKVKEQARAVIGLANQKQWGSINSMYSTDNNGSFPQNIAGDGMTNYEAYWCHATMNYYEDESLRFCPSAKRNKWAVGETEKGIRLGMIAETYGKTFMNWGPFSPKDLVTPTDWWDEFPEGSYGINEWCSNPPKNDLNGNPVTNVWGAPVEYTWRRVSNVDRANEVPLFMDNKLVDTHAGNPNATTNDPPANPDDQCTFWDYTSRPYHVICMDRHNGGINAVFVDGAARKVQLKELWKLKWHKSYSTVNEYTQPDYVWPDWMK